MRWPLGRVWVWTATLCGTCSVACAAAGPAQDAIGAYVAELEAAYDHASYRAAPPSQRYETEFFRQVKQLLAPDRHVAHSILVFPQDEDYVLVMRQRAAISIAEREKWVRLVPSLLQYLDYAKSLVKTIPMAPPPGASGRLRWQYPSLVREAILSFGTDALPFLESVAMDKRFRPELRLAALALVMEIDKGRAGRVGTRLQGDAFLDPDRLNGVLAGRITAADIAYSLAYPPKPKPQP